MAIFLGLNLPLLLGQAAEHWDGKDCFAPFYHYVASLIRSGALLGWNPFCNGGSPDFVEPQYGAASPVALAFGLLAGPGQLGFHLYWLGLWLFGGLGMYVFARALAAPPWGALVSALGYVLCGFYLGHAEHTSVVYHFSFVPWTVWRVRAAMSTGRWRPACEAGALWGLSALGGNPAIHLPETLFIGVAAPAFLPPVRGGRAAAWRGVRTYGVTLTLLVAVGTLVLLPAYGAFRYEVVGYSHRSLPLPREVVLGQGYGLGWLTALFTPAFVPLAGTVPAWSEFDVAYRLLYCGASVMILAGFAVWRRGAWREWVILAAGLLCLGTAMGTTLPLRGWLYDLVPPTRFVRNAATFRGFFLLAATMLAAVGAARVEATRRAPDAARTLRALTGSAAVGAVLAVVSYLWSVWALPDTLLAQASRMAPWHLGVAWIGTLLVCALAVRREGFRRFLPGVLAVLTAADLSMAFAASRNVAFDVNPSVAALGSAGPAAGPAAPGWPRAAEAPGNSNLYTRRSAFANYTAMRNLIQEDWARRPAMRQFACGTQRVWFATGVPTVPPTVEVYDAFRLRGRALGTLPVVRHERASLLQPPFTGSTLPPDVLAAIAGQPGTRPAHPDPAGSPLPPDVLAAVAVAPPATPVPAEVTAYHANDLTLRVTCPADGYLLVTDRWSRSWQATVDGQPVPVDGGDFLFRLVPVHTGENVVAMHYQIGWWYALIALSWTTLVAVAAGSLRYLLRRGPVPAAVRSGIMPAAPATMAVA